MSDLTGECPAEELCCSACMTANRRAAYVSSKFSTNTHTHKHTHVYTPGTWAAPLQFGFWAAAVALALARGTWLRFKNKTR